MPLPLVPARLLDPRPAAEAAGRPLAGAVNIPVDELAASVHELPPPPEPVRLADTPASPAAAQLLHARGRAVSLVTELEYLPAAPANVGRLWWPAPFVELVAAWLAPGSALDLGCGTGRDAVFLAAAGWRVTGMDLLPDALQRGRRMAARCAAAIAMPITWEVRNLERDPPRFEAAFDLVLLVRYVYRPLLPALAEWLRPGGSVVIEAFTPEHRARFGRPLRAADTLTGDELPALLPGVSFRELTAGWRSANVHTLRAWAQFPAAEPGSAPVR